MSQRYFIIRHNSLNSTQTELKNILSRDASVPSLTAVMAKTQQNGRGRSVSVWHDSPGHSTLLSVYVVWPDKLSESFLVNKWICHVLATILPKKVKYKWPNDLMVGAKKLGGLLIENRWEGSRITSSIIGLGLNVKKSQQQLNRAISLEEIGVDISLEECANSILQAISVGIHRISNPTNLSSRYNDLLWGKESYRTYSTSSGDLIKAQVIGVDKEGKLMLKTTDKAIHVFNLDDIRWLDSES
jgi:BirA family transcriptional regulator, biotin operon repressor / biotin---[acetyl-CoA-carboxylase] ligase